MQPLANDAGEIFVLCSKIEKGAQAFALDDQAIFVASDALGDGAAQAGAELIDERGEDDLFAGEVEVKDADSDARFLGDARDRGLLEAGFAKDFFCAVKKGLARALAAFGTGGLALDLEPG